MTQEEKELYNAANAYAFDIDSGDLNTNRDTFVAGAEWQKEQFEKERLKHCDELTAQQAQIESEFVTQHLKKNNRIPTYIDAIEYGKQILANSAKTCKDEQIKAIESLRHKWSLGDSAEAKYKVEAFDELLEMLKEE